MPPPDWEPRSPDDLLEQVKARGAQLRFRRRSRLLSGSIAVLTVTALLVAIGTRDRGGPTSLVADDPGGTTTTTSAAESSSTTTAVNSAEDEPRQSTTTTGRGASPTTTTIGTASIADVAPTSTTQPRATRGPFDPPTSGTYRYRTEVDGSERERRVTYAVVGRRDGETRLSERWDDPGVQPVDLLWRDEGVFVPNPSWCDEEGVKTRYAFPLSIGKTWSSDTTCSNERMGRTRTRSSARVTELTEITVAGRSIEAWVISLTITTEVTIAGVTQTNHSNVTEWFSAAHGLGVKSVAQFRHEPPSSAPNRGSTYEILNLDPE